MIKAPRNAPEAPRPDHNDVNALSERLLELAEQLARQAPGVANARTVKEFNGEQRKRALGLAVREFLATGDSAAAAETKGRASVLYGEVLDTLRAQWEEAEAAVAEHDATRAAFEAVRSVLSSLKTIAGNV